MYHYDNEKKAVIEMLDLLKGKKTYLLGLAAVVYGVLGYITGNLDFSTAQNAVWTGLTAMALRSAI